MGDSQIHRPRQRAARLRLRPASGQAGIGPTLIDAVDAATWARLTLADRVIAPSDPRRAHALVAAALADGATVSAAVVGSTVIGAAVVSDDGALLGLGVAPADRRSGLGAALLRASSATSAEVTVAERDPVEPASHQERMAIARRLFESAGFVVAPAGATVRSIDPKALTATRPPAGAVS